MRVRHAVAIGFLLAILPGMGCLGAPAPGDLDPAAAAGGRAETGYTVFRHSTLALLTPDIVPAAAGADSAVACAVTLGEYKSVQLGIRAVAGDLAAVRLEVDSDLEVRVYRRIDGKVRQLLLEQPNPVPAWIHNACLDESSEIAAVAADTTALFWITLHAPAAATPGVHRGRIRVRPANRPETDLALNVTVRPFALARARIAYAPFFYVNWGHGALPAFAQTDAWIEALFRDMAEHSHTSVIGLGYGVPGARMDFATIPPASNRTFSMLLPVARKTGLTSPDIPVVHMAHNLHIPEHENGLPLAARRRAMAWYEAERRRQGWPELAAYGNDEPAYPNPALRQRYESFRDVNMRLATAMNGIAAYGLGDMHDIWIVLGGHVTPEMCAEAERLGAQVWTYICAPLSTKPLHERYYAGLYVWAYRIKGHTTWHHYAQGGYKLVWMRESDARPMPLVGWETRREGIDDYRCLQMLEDAVAARPDQAPAGEARAWLAELRRRILESGVDPHNVTPGAPFELAEYDGIRDRAAGYIERLGAPAAEPIAIVTPAGLKDEARPFRKKSVQECIAGLRDPSSAVRRAAAWALFEKGPDAVPAVPILAGLLSDAEVRMPALRALEAIGPQCVPALPQVAALVKHEDGFVRIGTACVLGSMGAPAIDALTEAVQDDYPPAALAAGRALLRLGPNALPALPALIGMLDGPDWAIQEPALKAIAGIGPAAAEAVPHILRNWQGRFPCYSYWMEPLTAIGPDAKAAVPMLERFREEHGSHAVHSVDAEVLYALCRIRNSPADLQALIDLIAGQGGGPRDAGRALKNLEQLGRDAAAAEPWVRGLLAAGNVADEVKTRLEAFLAVIAPDPAD